MYYPLLFKAGKLGYKGLKSIVKGTKTARKKLNLTKRAEGLRKSGFKEVPSGTGVMMKEASGLGASVKRKAGSAALGAIKKTKAAGKNIRKYHKEYSFGAAGYGLSSFLDSDD